MALRWFRTAATSAALAGLAVGSVACSGGSTTASSPSPSATSPSATALPSTLPTGGSASPSGPSAAPTSLPGGSGTAAAQPFGSQCSQLPDGGSNLADQPVITVLSRVPSLSQLASAINIAGLGDRLNSIGDITVFAPTDDAFRAVSSDRLGELLRNPSLLGNVLQYHVVRGKLTPQTVVGTHQTLEGANLTVAGSGTNLTVNGTVPVVCGNIQAANATVYVINQVLTPPS